MPALQQNLLKRFWLISSNPSICRINRIHATSHLHSRRCMVDIPSSSIMGGRDPLGSAGSCDSFSQSWAVSTQEGEHFPTNEIFI